MSTQPTQQPDEVALRRARADVRDYLRRQEAEYLTLQARLSRSLGEQAALRTLAEVMAERYPLRWATGLDVNAGHESEGGMA